MVARKLIIVTGLILVCGLLFANNTDSLTIQKLTEKITLLENKVDVLNEANNKLNTITWAVIGTINGLFAIIIGLNFWSNFKLNRQKLLNIKDELKSYVETELFEKHKEETEASIETKINVKLGALKNSDKLIEYEITKIHIQLLKKELGETTNEYGYHKIDKLIFLLNLSVELENYHGFQGNSVGVHDALKSILEYVKSQQIDFEEKKRLIDNLATLNNGYEIYTDEIKKLIKT
jgi:hypothetical protein